MSEHRTEGPTPAEGPPRQYVGLLTQVMSNTLDEDYATVAARGRTGGRGSRRTASIAVAAVLAAFGGLVGISALKTEQDRPIAAAERTELVDQINDRQDRLDGLQSQLAELRADVSGLQESVADEVTASTRLRDRVTVLAFDAGTIAATGPGIVITADDAPGGQGGTGGVILDKDLQALVNGLWAAGAEAIAIDDHRLTSLTAIRFAGRAITVDYRSLTPPYVIDVIGNPDTLQARFLETEAGQVWRGLESNFGIRFDTVAKEKVTVPADPHEHLLYAKPAVDR